MYRIELRPGKEASYQSFDEFAAAVQAGIVSADARVWHGASSKWLPITVHPHYKRALAAPPKPAPAPAPVAAAPVAPAPVAPAPAPPAPEPVEKQASKPGDLEFLEVPDLLPHAPRAVSGSLFGPPAAPPKHIEALVAAAGSAPAPEPVSEPADEILIDISRPRPSWLNRRTAGIAAGIVVVASAVTVIMTHTSSAPDSRQAADSAPTVSSTSLAATPSSSFEVTAPPDTSSFAAAADSTPAPSQAYMPMPVIPEGPAAMRTQVESTSARILPAAPRLGKLEAGAVNATSTSATALAGRYNAAHDAAVAALENRLRASGITSLFSNSRLASGSVSDTRLAVSGIANFIRNYRTEVSAIEGAYRDTAGQLSGDWTDKEAAGWYKGMTRGESQAQARAADQLLADISSLLGVLEEQAGAYTLASGKITFRDAGATLRYGTLRRRVVDRLASADTSSAVVSSLRKVIGSTQPPAEAFTE